MAFAAALGKACDLIKRSWESPPWPLQQQEVAAAAAAAAAPAAAAAASSKEAEDPPHPSKLGFVAKVFVEGLWMVLEKETNLRRQQREPLLPVSLFYCAVLKASTAAAPAAHLLQFCKVVLLHARMHTFIINAHMHAYNAHACMDACIYWCYACCSWGCAAFEWASGRRRSHSAAAVAAWDRSSLRAKCMRLRYSQGPRSKKTLLCLLLHARLRAYIYICIYIYV